MAAETKLCRLEVGVVPGGHLVVVLRRLRQLVQVVEVEVGRVSAYVHRVHRAVRGASAPVVGADLEALHRVYWYLVIACNIKQKRLERTWM